MLKVALTITLISLLLWALVTGYLLFLTIFAWIAKKKTDFTGYVPTNRFLVIIPAHNEAAVIGPCIDAVLNDRSALEGVEVIVVCNGCTDETVDLAHLRDVVVLEVSEASKAAALSAGDAAASSFPRLYLRSRSHLSFLLFR